MQFLVENSFFIVVLGVCVAMHFFMHGHGHGKGDPDRQSHVAPGDFGGDRSTSESEAMRPRVAVRRGSANDRSDQRAG